MWDIWTALLFLSIALPISLTVMALIATVDKPKSKGKNNVGHVRENGK